MKGDIGKAWDKLMDHSFVTYRGFIAEKTESFFKFKGDTYHTQTGLYNGIDEYIKTGGNKIINSIKENSSMKNIPEMPDEMKDALREKIRPYHNSLSFKNGAVEAWEYLYPEIERMKADTPQMSNELAAMSDVAALEYAQHCERFIGERAYDSSHITEAHECGQIWMWRRLQQEINDYRILLSELVEPNNPILLKYPKQ